MKIDKKTFKQLLILMLVAVGLFWLTQNYKILFGFISKTIDIFFPFILGLCIAFILNAPLKVFENKIFKVDKIESKRKKKFIRILSIILVFLLFIGIIAFVLFLVLPEIVDTISSFGTKIPIIFNDLKSWIIELTKNYPELQLQIQTLNWSEASNSIMNFIETSGKGILNSSLTFISSLFSGLFTLFLGSVFSIYILSEKENLGVQIVKIMNAYLPKKLVVKLLEIQKTASSTFASFINVQCLEACILGLMFFIALSIFKFPYAVLISVLVTVTALIPVFGAFIAMVIGGLLIAVNNPLQAIWFVILFVVLQQIEGNFIYPRVVGKTVGLPALWVMLAVMVGGSAFGIVGMLISVPVSSMLYSIIKNNINKKEKESKIELSN